MDRVITTTRGIEFKVYCGECGSDHDFFKESLVIKQWIQNWDAKFRGGDMTSRDLEPSERMEDLFRAEGSTIFEISCGLGVNSMRLESMGYDVTTTDVSVEAVRITSESSGQNTLPLTRGRFDVVNDDAPVRKYDAVFDKGCLHSFATQAGRLNFARKAHEIVKPGGKWINLVRGEQACDWGMRYRSVLGFGKATPVEDGDGKRPALAANMEQYGERVCSFPEKALAGTTVFRVKIEAMTGKQSAIEPECQGEKMDAVKV